MERPTRQCEECGVFTSNDSHTCIEYNGPTCTIDGCNEPTVFVHIGAPGTGSGWSCRAGHYDGTNRELTIDDVI